ncbi:hypothetical protein ADL01_26940 [Streptomyces sp. NRRL WC-3618]|nr:hypothetical protein ADL01_26940 [Streptomyces sp. NRRL WC-3618]
MLEYEASRPSYPPVLFDFVEEFLCRSLKGARAADIGAGRGIATALLHERRIGFARTRSCSIAHR